MEDVWLELCKQAIIQNAEKMPDMNYRLHYAIGFFRQCGHEDISELLEMIYGSCYSNSFKHSE